MMAGWTGALLLAAVAVPLTILAVRLLGYRESSRVSWTDADSVEEGPIYEAARYEPMMRLISEDDIEFLKSQPGYRPEIGARLRNERRRILRMYLRELARDFQRLHAAARKAVADAPEQHSELVGELLQYQFTFWKQMAVIEFRLAVPGARLPHVEIAGLLRPMQSMQLSLERA
jgi:hypothetical protein